MGAHSLHSMLSLVCVFIILAGANTEHKSMRNDCPCAMEELCNPIESGPRKEVIGYVLRQTNWKSYNWTYITTLMMFTELPPDLMCFAHSKGVRVVLGGLNGFSVANLTNSTARSTWIATQLKLVEDSFADGINLDIEEPVANGSIQQKLLTQFVGEVYSAFKGVNKYYQVTYDVAWSPNCIDGRCYEAKEFAEVTDFLVVMSYDEQGQIYGPCIAMANSPLDKTMLGVKQYLDLGISADKLVLGQPWYGYDYTCVDYDAETEVCSIKHVPYHGAPCSDAAGTQHDYSLLRQVIVSDSLQVSWNSTYQSPYFQREVEGTMHQYWFDDPRSLSIKFIMAHRFSLRGLAFWNMDALDFSTSSHAVKDTTAMWAAIDYFFS